MENNSELDFEVLTSVLTALKKLDQESQERTLRSVATFLGIQFDARLHHPMTASHELVTSGRGVSFTEDRNISAKDFLREKSPNTDIERVACLAFYLAHYRETPHFKTIDISALNTEAAQPKFSNAAFAVDNATKAGLLVPAVKGSKQLSAAGETYVQALPDRDAARATLKETKPKRKKVRARSAAK